jgi:RHS repeat-associated protein
MKRLLLVGAVAILACSPSWAQAPGPNAQQGLVPYGVFQKDSVDSVNLANGNVLVRIPLVSYPQRGGKLKLSFTVVESNKGWYIYNNGQSASWVYGGGQAWVFPVQAIVGKPGTFSWTDGNNKQWTMHTLSAITSDYASHEIMSAGADPRYPVDGYSTDGTGIHGAGGTPTGFIDREGVTYTGGQPILSGYTGSYTPPTSIVDPNGNEVTYGSNGWTDTVGRVIPGYPTSGSMLAAPGVASNTTNCPSGTASAVQWNLPAYNGSTSVIKFCYENFNYQTNFGMAGVSEASGTLLLMSAVVLPNLSTWKFTYDSYLDISSITFPTGGTINYSWENYQFSGTSWSRAVTSRTVNANDGTGNHTWNYQYGVTVGSSSVNIVTDPDGNDTLNTPYSGGYISETEAYSGSHNSGTLLKTVTTQFTSSQGDGLCEYGTSHCGGAINVLPVSTTISWPNGKTSQTTTTYDSGFQYQIYNWDGTESYYTALYGLPTLQTYSDYGQGSPGSLLKQASTTYEWQNNSNYGGLLDLVATSKILDASGNNCAETDYTYDTASRLFSSGISTQHTTPPLAERGNLSATTRQLASASTPCSANPSWTPITSYVNVYDTGTIYQTIDPLTNTTTINYSSTFAGAYPTTITNALSQVTTENYDSNTGLLISIKDPNLQTTSFTYDDMFRLYTANYPDGGLVTISHQESTFPFTATLTKKINSSQNKVNTNVFDGLGRVSESELTSDPQGTIYTSTTYDPLGREYTVSNPYRSTSDPTYGLTTYTYDTLNRTTLVTKPDSSTVKTAYCDNTTLVTDEAGHWRRSTVDGLGRLSEVDEPNSLTATVNSNGCPAQNDPIWVTTYSYDNLSNLTGIVQGGSRNRSFVYDTLSRLSTSTNPESGTITYVHDADGNVHTKQDARSITTTYSYDALNRATGMTYSNSDPSVAYTYDQSSCLGLSACYNIGRRTTMTDAGGTENLAYDTMGREWAEQRTTGSITKSTSYLYDLAGDLTSLTYPSGRTLTYTYDSAGRPSDAVDTANSVNYAVGSCTNGASSPSTGACYGPTGALSQMQNGTNLVSTYLYNTRLQPCWIYATTGTALATTATCTTSDPGPGNILDLQYNFNLGSGDNGNVIGITNNRDTTRSQSFTYDQVNRILTAAGSTYATKPAHCWGEAYTYDQWANMTAIGVLSSSYNGCTQDSLSVTATSNNQLSATGFSYDASGNMLTDSANTYVYNAESEIKTAAGKTYTYDGDGNRIEKSSGVIFWYGAGTEILDESNFSGTFTSEYVFFGGKRIARRDVSSGNIYYYEEDMLGSSRTVVQAGQTSPCYDSDFRPFGSELSITNSCLQEYKFEGKERDTETGNDDFGARYYRSNLGRWLSSDWSSVPAPVPYANLANPQTLNLYAMVSDNPETFADLDGHIEWAPFRLVESVIASGGVADILEMMEGMAGPSGYATGLTYEGTLNSQAAQQQGQSTAPTTPTAQSSNTTTESAQQQNNTTGYSTQDAAAKAGLNAINPTSIKQNKEYAGLIYKDADGNYHYTTPNKGKGTSSSVGTAPDGTTVVGDYHTHGDYSRPILFGLFVVRTSAAKDAYNSDHFSDTDMAENRDSARSNPQFRGYLGTPSGALRIYNPITDTEGPLQ